MPPPPAYLSWSSGKDSAFALLEAERQGLAQIVGLLTTVNDPFGRVAMHGVRRQVLEAQVAALGLPCIQVPLPWPCSNDHYEGLMARATQQIRAQGVAHLVFGDLFLADIRHYREQQMARAGMTALFPLWGRDTGDLAQAMIAAGLGAHVACLDPRQLDPAFAGRPFDDAFLGDLPAGVDPCGENGEFHTVVSTGPGFHEGLDLERGETVERDGFVFTDFRLASS